MQILVFVDSETPRVKYIVGHILENMLGFDVVFTQRIDEINTFRGPKICYSNNKINDSIQITPNSLLSNIGIIKQSFAFFKWKSLPVFFQTNLDSDIPFDIFSASFYLITRYEEYITKNYDAHGRFCVEESLALQNGFLHIPLVDLWVRELGRIIVEKFPGTPIKKSEFNFLPTIDIDNAYAFKYKGFLRSSLGLANSLLNLRVKEFGRRIAVHLNLFSDPYDTYNELFRILDQSNESVWFILGGNYGKFDKNISLDKEVMRNLVKRIDNKFHLGIHPSYSSNSQPELISKEKDTLEKLLGKKIVQSRQHYLRLTLPTTYQTLSNIGITHDYSMGYSNAIGFRASTCTPFNFYNLIDENELPLSIVPFQVMDRSLLQGLEANPSEAVRLTLEMAKRVKDVGGTFVTVWHNESLSGINEWKGWEDVLGRIVLEVRSLKSEVGR